MNPSFPSASTPEPVAAASAQPAAAATVPSVAGAPSLASAQPAAHTSTAAAIHSRETLESLTRCVLEILAGVRDLDQLARWVSDEVYQNLQRRVVLSSRARQVKGHRTIRPTFTIGRVISSEPAPGVVEGVVIVHGKARTRAVALRLEVFDSRWRASAINVL